jgi:hypothetical protein
VANLRCGALTSRKEAAGCSQCSPSTANPGLSVSPALSSLSDHDLFLKVTFRYRTSDTGKLRTCILPVKEFIRHFLQHVLSKGFVKVRYYGFLSSGLRQWLDTLRQQLGRPPADPPPFPEGTDVDAQTVDHVADDSVPDRVVRCPSCGRVVRRRSTIRPQGRCPP